MVKSSLAAFDPRKTISFMLNPHGRQADYDAERLVRLFELQCWMVASDPEFHTDAARLAGFCLLEQIEERMKKQTGSLYLPGARTLFDDDEYRSIYNHVIGRYGGLSRLMNSPKRQDLEDKYDSLQNGIKTSCDLIDYRFRFLDYGGSPKTSGNISHAQYFILTDPKRKISWGTLSSRWSAHKRKALFLYVMFRCVPEMQPHAFSEKDFLGKLQAQANDSRLLETFFGTVKYVAKVLGEPQLGQEDVIPDELPSVRPATIPMTNEQLRLMHKYGEFYMHMKTGFPAEAYQSD